MAFLEFTFRGFWTFFGVAFLLTFVVHYGFRCWNRLLRTFNVRKHGWPPAHCDADGDFKEPKDE